jgi:hypothetical protein
MCRSTGPHCVSVLSRRPSPGKQNGQVHVWAMTHVFSVHSTAVPIQGVPLHEEVKSLRVMGDGV